MPMIPPKPSVPCTRQDLEWIRLTKTGNIHCVTRDGAQRMREADLVDISWDIDQMGNKARNPKLIDPEKFKKIRKEVINRTLIGHERVNNPYGTSDYTIAQYTNADRCYMTIDDYNQIKKLETKGIYVGAKDTLFIDYNGEGHLCSARDVPRLKEEMELRKNKALQLVELTNGNTVYVDYVKYRQLAKEGRLRYTNNTIERNEEEVNNLPAKLDNDKKEDLDILDPRAMIQKYISNEDEASNLYDSIYEVDNKINGLIEPDVIEDIGVWQQWKYEKESLVELAGKTKQSNNERIAEIKEENKYLAELLFESENVPNNKWIRSGDKGIFIEKMSNSYPGTAVAVKSWKGIQEQIKSDKKNVSTKITSDTGLPDSTLKAIGGVSLLTVAIVPAIILGLAVGTPFFFGWIVGFSILMLIFGSND